MVNRDRGRQATVLSEFGTGFLNWPQRPVNRKAKCMRSLDNCMAIDRVRGDPVRHRSVGRELGARLSAPISWFDSNAGEQRWTSADKNALGDGDFDLERTSVDRHGPSIRTVKPPRKMSGRLPSRPTTLRTFQRHLDGGCTDITLRVAGRDSTVVGSEEEPYRACIRPPRFGAVHRR